MNDQSAPDRIVTIDGRRVMVFDRPKPIPPTLALMLDGGRDRSGRPWIPLRVTRRYGLRLGLGPSLLCATDDHRMTPWLEGVHAGSDGIVRDLRLLACPDCGAVCVRDVSIDSLPGARPGRMAPRRRDNVVGWYSGARARGRTYGRAV
jgi:hypothetical protein